MSGRYHHYLGIGATGMLSGATSHFCGVSETQTIVARRASAYVRRLGLESAIAVDADWSNHARYLNSVSSAIVGRGGVDLCLLWLHRSGLPLIEPLLSLLDKQGCRVIHVVGSLNPRQREQSAIRYPEHIVYHVVTLGSVNTRTGRRWLTHEEIVSGVLSCERNQRDVLVGQLVDDC